MGGAEAGDESAPDPWLEDPPVLAGLAGASVQGRVALGARAGAEVRRCGASAELRALAPSNRGPCHAHDRGFDLQAGVCVAAGDRERLERICRYALRPPVAQDRIELTPQGQVLLVLRHRWADGTTHVWFDPLELLERLAALTPRPRINLVLYYGVLGAHAGWRARLGGVSGGAPPAGAAPVGDPACPHGGNRLWAQLLARSFGFAVLVCPRCGGRLRLIALIEDAHVIRQVRASEPAG